MCDETYVEVCEALGLSAYQDQEHEDNGWRLYGGNELFLIMAQKINALENK